MEKETKTDILKKAEAMREKITNLESEAKKYNPNDHDFTEKIINDAANSNVEITEADIDNYNSGKTKKLVPDGALKVPAVSEINNMDNKKNKLSENINVSVSSSTLENKGKTSHAVEDKKDHHTEHGESKIKKDLHHAYEEDAHHNHDHEEHHQDVSGINPEVLEKFKKFGVSPEELAKIDNFKNFDKAKQSLLAQDYNQFMLAEVKQRARDEFNKKMHAKDQENFLSRSWNRMKYNVRKEYLNAKYEKKAFLDLSSDHKGLLEALNGLSNSIKDKNVKILNGKVVIEYLSPKSESNSETKAVYDKLNELGAEFRAMPGDWAMESATKKEQEKYQNKKEEFRQAALRVIKYEVLSNGRSKKEMLSLLGTAESNIQLDQELITSPDAEKVLGNIKKQPAILRGLNNIMTERGATALASALGRNVLVGTLGLVAFPAVGAAIGGVKGRKRARKSIFDQDKDMRQADAMYKVGNKETAQNVVDAKSMEKKLETLINKIKDPNNESIKQELMNSLTARINYTERKLSERKINFGAVSSKTANIFALSQVLAEAEALHAVYEKPKDEEKTLERTIDERLDAYLNLRGQKISKARRDYVKNQIIKSATYGALAGAAGVAIREGIHALMDGNEIASGGDAIVPVPTKPAVFDLEGDSVPASSSGSIQSFINLRDKMISHYQDEQRYPEFKGLDKDGIVKKLLDTGRFDKFTSQIMIAHGIEQFTAIAKEHGFLDPNGMGNSAVESASIPKGSFIGMQLDSNGDMQYYIELPDGKQIPIDDNFSEALNQYKGVQLIDTSRPKISVDAGNTSGVNSSGEAIITNGNISPDGDLDASDYGYGQEQTGAGNSLDGGAPVRAPGDIIDNSISSAPTGAVDTGDYIKDLYIENPNIDSPVGLFDYLMNHTKSTIHVQPDGLNTSRYAMTIPPDPRIDAGARDYYIGLLKSDKASAIVIDGKKYMLPSHENSLNKSLEDYNLVYDKHIVRYGDIENHINTKGASDYEILRAKTENVYNQQGQTTGGENIDQIYEQNIRQATDVQATKWVDQSFGKNNIFGRHTNGVETRAWARMRNDTIGEHLKARNGGGIRYTGSGKEKAFMSNLYNAARSYNIVLDPNESVSSATRRIAEAAARSQSGR